jgi:hypothetical protein
MNKFWRLLLIMKIRRLILLVVLFFSCCFCIYSIYKVNKVNSMEVINTSQIDVSSTKEWQDILCTYINTRNDIINNILDGKYINKKYINKLKSIECEQLLNGDIMALDYMQKYPGNFLLRLRNVKIEYSDIRQLTKDEVMMVSNISYLENNIERKYNYETVFKNIEGKWLMSKLSYCD